MSKNLFAVALFCLHVIPVNSFAANVSNSDIDQLVEGSRQQTQEQIRAKIQENQRLVLEIDKVQRDLDKIKADIATNQKSAKRDLIIAGGSAAAAAIGYFFFMTRRGGGELSIELNYMFALGSALTGASAAIWNGGKAGVQQIMIHLDEKKIPALETQLANLKAQLEKQTEELIK